VKVLLDTHAVLWAMAEPTRLSRKARRFLASGAGPLVSAATLWEITLKAQAGKLILPASPARFLEAHLAELQAITLPVRPNHVFRTFALPRHHKDPFDRLLIAQALEEGAAIMTADRLIASYPVEILW